MAPALTPGDPGASGPPNAGHEDAVGCLGGLWVGKREGWASVSSEAPVRTQPPQPDPCWFPWVLPRPSPCPRGRGTLTRGQRGQRLQQLRAVGVPPLQPHPPTQQPGRLKRAEESPLSKLVLLPTALAVALPLRCPPVFLPPHPRPPRRLQSLAPPGETAELVPSLGLHLPTSAALRSPQVPCARCHLSMPVPLSAAISWGPFLR